MATIDTGWLQAQAYFRTNPLKYLVHLKYMHLYRDIMTCTVLEHRRKLAVLLRYPANRVMWDSAAYPTAEQVFLPAAADDEMAKRLLELVQRTLPSDNPQVIKFCEPDTEALFQQHLPLEFLRLLISYTSAPNAHYGPATNVTIESHPRKSCIAFYVDNGYSPTEISHYFANGAVAFSIYDDDQPLCTCMTYQNFDNVWEIGGVHTLEHARRKGYARQVVQTALSHVLKQGNIPRYQVEATNIPSVRLAESLGLQPCLYFKHYLLPHASRRSTS